MIEYKAVFIRPQGSTEGASFHTTGEITALLNEKGVSGWKLAHALPASIGYLFIFERYIPATVPGLAVPA